MQLVDSNLPTGGFAHSAGLEAAWQQGRVRDPAELSAFVQAAIGQAAYSSLPSLAQAHALSVCSSSEDDSCADTIRSLSKIDAGQQALLASNATACRASAIQGAAILVREPLASV